MSWVQLLAGTWFPILDDIQTPSPHLYPMKWIPGIQKYMSSNNSHITLENTFITPLEHECDIHIMDLALQHTDHLTTLKNSMPVGCTFKSSYSAISLQLTDAMFSLEMHKVKHLPPPNPLPYFHINLIQMWHHGKCGGSSFSRFL